MYPVEFGAVRFTVIIVWPRLSIIRDYLYARQNQFRIRARFFKKFTALELVS